jgi:hypothetical protein
MFVVFVEFYQICFSNTSKVWYIGLSATFNNMSVILVVSYLGGQFYWWRKSECPEKTTDLPQEGHALLTIMIKHTLLHSVFNILIS